MRLLRLALAVVEWLLGLAGFAGLGGRGVDGGGRRVDGTCWLRR
jgi:hypothetical protein